MIQVRKNVVNLCMIAMIGAVAAGCGGPSEVQKSSTEQHSTQINQTNTPPTSSDVTKQDTRGTTVSTRKFTDYKGHSVDIPVKPQRVIYHGETLSDLLALQINAVGTSSKFFSNTVYEDKVKQHTVDVGFPINLEKALGLEPDLIILASTDEQEYAQLSKIAPTVMFDTFAPLDERITLLGSIVGKEQQAKEWLADYHAKADKMWDELHKNGLGNDETASVFTYYPGNRLFVMASTGLSQVLYQPNGFKPTAPIQEILNNNTGFKEISMELLPKYAGDRIFILTPIADEAKRSTEDLLQSAMWKELPAVKQGHVYSLDIVKSGSDALTREWLVEKLPKLLKK
ncbi:ABC transporter substrate-binding protein [Brevibacillus laterosporus]|uniref:ABC transporter substrate-binding protein n=1 Tax=Brevibacillus laterosporus TaxID=1465 RepID=UPI00215CDFF7|nr:ABC transporter substrate-binding protein [Brevibacillus laterosporus]MCR8993440.1 ABC transporter substrate-binding protein [Brevibacillus laterosporus]